MALAIGPGTAGGTDTAATEPSVQEIIHDAENGIVPSGKISFAKLLAVYCAVEEQDT